MADDMLKEDTDVSEDTFKTLQWLFAVHDLKISYKTMDEMLTF